MYDVNKHIYSALEWVWSRFAFRWYSECVAWALVNVCICSPNRFYATQFFCGQCEFF